MSPSPPLPQKEHVVELNQPHEAALGCCCCRGLRLTFLHHTFFFWGVGGDKNCLLLQNSQSSVFWDIAVYTEIFLLLVSFRGISTYDIFFPGHHHAESGGLFCMLVSAQTWPGTSSASPALVPCLISLKPGLSDRVECLSVSLLIPLNLLHISPRHLDDRQIKEWDEIFTAHPRQFLTLQFIKCSMAIRWLLPVTCLRCSRFNNPSRHVLRKED